MKIFVDRNAKTAFFGANDNVLAGPSVKMFVEAAPFINAEFSSFSAAESIKPGFAGTDKSVGFAGVTGEKTAKNTAIRALDNY